MSWSIQSAGSAEHVKEFFAKRIEQTSSYMGETEKAILAAHKAVVDAHCDKAIAKGQARPILAESSGHHGDSDGSSKLEVRTIYEG